MQEFTNMPPNLRLKHERELRGWTQQYVAEQLAVPLGSVRDWEDGFMSPNSYYRERLCILYQKDAEALGLNEEMYSAEELYIPSQNSTPLPIMQGEKLRLNNRRRRGNLFNIGIILIVLAVILLPSLWFLVAKAQHSTRLAVHATPLPQSTTQLSPTNSHSTPSLSQTSRTTLPGKTPNGVTTASTSGPATATSTLPGGLSPTTGLGTPTPTSGLPGYPEPTSTGNPLSPTTVPGTATPTPTPTATPCIIPTETIGVVITVTDDMQDPNSPCYYAPTTTHRADAPPGVHFTTDLVINGDSTFAERTYANEAAPYILWECSNITTFSVIAYFDNWSRTDPDFNFYYSTDPRGATPTKYTPIPGIDTFPINGSTNLSGWTSRTYTVTNLPGAGVNFIEIGWSTIATTITNTTPRIGQVTMTCTGGY